MRKSTNYRFAGRKADLARAGQVLEECLNLGRPGTLLITGEAGIGKTRFVDELTRNLDTQRWLILRGECPEFSAGTLPFGAFREMVPDLLNAAAALRPGLRESPAGRAIATLAGIDNERASGDPGDLAAMVLHELAGAKPVLVIFDDLHWADSSTIDLLAKLAWGLRRSPAVIAGCFRDDEVTAGHILRPLIGVIERNRRPERIALGPLSLADVRELTSDGHSSTDLQRLIERTNGNPFLIEELLESASEEVPVGVRDIVLARFERLGEDARGMGRIAAATPTLSRAVFEAASGRETARFDHGLDDLVHVGLLVEREGRLGLRHALMREAIWSATAPGERHQIHGRLGEAIELREPSRSGEAARHWLAAGNKEKALVASLSGARFAQQSGAQAAAADLYLQALQLWEQLPRDTAPTLTGRTVGSVLQMARYALCSCGRFDTAIELLDRWLSTSGALSRSERALVLFNLGQACRDGTTPTAWGRTVDVHRDALEESRHVEEPEVASWIIAVSVIELITNHGLDCEAKAVWSGQDDTLQHVSQLTSQVSSYTKLWIAASDGLLELAAIQKEETPAASGLAISKTRLLGRMGFARAAASHGKEVVEAAFQRGALDIAHIAEWEVARALRHLGQYEEAFARLDALQERIGTDSAWSWPDLLEDGWSAMLARSGKVDLATEIHDAAAPWVANLAGNQAAGAALARVELARVHGDISTARIAIETALTNLRGHLIALCGEPVAAAAAFEAAVVRTPEEKAEAVARIDRWLGRLRECLVDAPMRVRISDFGLYLELIEAERDRIDGACEPERWQDLAGKWRAVPRPYDAACCELRAAASLLVGRGISRESRLLAENLLRSAWETYAEIGVHRMVEEVERLAGAAGLRLEGGSNRQATRAADTTKPVLTPRERAVLREMMAGQTNGQIGLALGITTKTASTHVSNILAKLKAKSRLEAALKAREFGIEPK